jgi:mRNA-degrading endonuclease toxin of MazEF toxin-antitoxin module
MGHEQSGIPAHVEIESEFLNLKSYIKTENIRSVSTKQFIKNPGNVNDRILGLVEERVKLLLGFI